MRFKLKKVAKDLFTRAEAVSTPQHVFSITQEIFNIKSISYKLFTNLSFRFKYMMYPKHKILKLHLCSWGKKCMPRYKSQGGGRPVRNSLLPEDPPGHQAGQEASSLAEPSRYPKVYFFSHNLLSA